MRNQLQRNQRQHYGDLRTLDHHESWKGVYALLEVEPSIESDDYDDYDEADRKRFPPTIGDAAYRTYRYELGPSGGHWMRFQQARKRTIGGGNVWEQTIEGESYSPLSEYVDDGGDDE